MDFKDFTMSEKKEEQPKEHIGQQEKPQEIIVADRNLEQQREFKQDILIKKSVERKPRKGNFSRKITIITLCVIFIPIVTFLLYFHYRYAQMNQVVAYGSSAPNDELALGTETEEPTSTNLPEANPSDIQSIIDVTVPSISSVLPIAANTSGQSQKAVNVLLLGVDTRDPNSFNGRTDTIIIANIDPNKKTIKLISIMRDILLEVPNHKDLNRINTVLEFGGPDAVISTIRRYFGINIDYYAIVNFWGIADIIDTLGGVGINVQQDEIYYLNGYLDELNADRTNDLNSPHINKSGLQKLDGKQAVSYMRIRYVGNGDYQRTDRQRTVLDSLTKVNRSLLEILNIVNKIPSFVRTNSNELQMVSLANMIYGLRGSPIQQMRIPVNNSYRGAMYNGMSILIVDFTKNARALQEFLNN